MADSADVIVVGGGVIGCAAALHLASAGLSVVLVERDDVGQATSAAGAGFIGMWAAGWATTFGHEHIAIERYGLDFYRALAETRNDFGYLQNGNLYVATTQKAWDSFVAPHVADPTAVPNLRRLTAEEIADLTGIFPADRLYGGILHPDGAQLSAAKAARAIADQFVEAGGRLATRRPVTGLKCQAGRIRGVETLHGPIRAERVVIAAGAWTNAILRGLGIWLPMTPLVAFRVLTEALGVPRTMPTVMLGEVPMYIRGENGALLWGMHYRERPRFAFVDAEVPERFDQLPLDGFFEVKKVAQAVARTVPLLAQARSQTVAFGAPTFTPDQRPFLGAIAEVDGLYVAVGCNEAGVTHAPGYGQLLAELLENGRTTLCSVQAFDPARFGTTHSNEHDVLVALQRTRPAI